MTTVKANCILLDVRGRYYYAEEFGKFIQIEQWEYDRILNNPSLYYFSIALQKHFEWSAAVGKATTLTFLEVLERHIGGVTAKASIAGSISTALCISTAASTSAAGTFIKDTPFQSAGGSSSGRHFHSRVRCDSHSNLFHA